MGQVIHIYPTRQPPENPRFTPAEVLNTDLRKRTFCYFRAAKQAAWAARHDDALGGLARQFLANIMAARPTERLACAAGGTLASLGHGYALDGWGASA